MEKINMDEEIFSRMSSKYHDYGIFIAVKNGVLAGFLTIREDEDNNYLINCIEVWNGFQRQKVGKSLVCKLIEHVESNSGNREIIAGIYKNNFASQRLFEGLGFKLKKIPGGYEGRLKV